MIRFIDLIAYLGALTAIGAGVAWKDPAAALVVVGSIVLTTVIGARILSRPRRLPAPRKDTRTNEPA